jgi:hypothetical protein
MKRFARESAVETDSPLVPSGSPAVGNPTNHVWLIEYSYVHIAKERRFSIRMEGLEYVQMKARKMPIYANIRKWNGRGYHACLVREFD